MNLKKKQAENILKQIFIYIISNLKSSLAPSG